jgi:hypothetical protein
MVVWDGNGPGDGAGIFARRYALQGSPFGPEFRVNSTVVDNDSDPAVTCRALGGQAVVVWSSLIGSTGRIRGQRYDSNGAPLGTEFDTGFVGGFIQGPPDVCDNEDGEFVVVWANSYNVAARRYTSSGTLVGSTILVNENQTGGDGDHPFPKVCCGYRRNGNFVVTWNEINYPNLGQHRLKAARFDLATGTKLDSGFNEILVTTADIDIEPDISCSDDGDFVVVWDPTGPHVQGQRYDSSGNAVGSIFSVTSSGTGSHMPAVSSDFFGDFVVAWRADADGGNIVVQKYTSAGAKSGGALVVNETSPGIPFPFPNPPAVASTANDKAVVAWSSANKDGSGDAVVGRRLGCL